MSLPSTKSITCPVCHMVSYNPNDIEWGYCGNCHAYTSPVNPLMKAKRMVAEAKAKQLIEETRRLDNPGRYWPDGDLGDDPDGDIAGYDGA